MIEIKTVNKGAELISIKFNGEEKMHDGESFWNRHAPVLFPIVGKLKDGKTIIENNTYEMGQHGFARDMEFEEVAENSYVLKYNEETLKKYPYKFELYISYEITEDTVTTKYKVVNKDDKQIMFGLGGHPSFKCDYSTGKYSLEFKEKEENLKIYQLDGGLLKSEPENKDKFFENNRIILNNETFVDDALILKDLKSREVVLKDDEGVEKLIFKFEKFPYLGVWSKPGASFVCIEPWFNTTDKIDTNGEFSTKENLIRLEAKEEFTAEYSVKFL